MSLAFDQVIFKQKDLTPIMEKSIEGVASQLVLFFPNKKVAVVDGNADTFKRNLAKQNKQIEYPFFSVTFSNVESNTAGYNMKTLLRQGRLAAKINDEHGFQKGTTKVADYADLKNYLVPVNVDLTISLITNSYRDVIDFAQRWIISATRNLLYLQLVFDDDTKNEAYVSIKVEQNPSVSIPSVGLDEQEEFRIDVTARMQTYVGYSVKTMRVLGYDLNSYFVQEHENADATKTPVTTISNFNQEITIKDY